MATHGRPGFAGAWISPLGRRAAQGVAAVDGTTTPFLVQRSWSAPGGGTHREWWLIRRPAWMGGDVAYRSPERRVRLREGATGLVEVVRDPVRLEPGPWEVEFVVDGVPAGTAEIEVADRSSATAAA